MLDCAGLKMVYYEGRGEGKDKAHHMSTVNVLIEEIKSLLSVR